jgi:ABC-type transport system involved in multi-copper enzyme maturation permease subunit
VHQIVPSQLEPRRNTRIFALALIIIIVIVIVIIVVVVMMITIFFGWRASSTSLRALPSSSSRSGSTISTISSTISSSILATTVVVAIVLATTIVAVVTAISAVAVVVAASVGVLNDRVDKLRSACKLSPGIVGCHDALQHLLRQFLAHGAGDKLQKLNELVGKLGH